MPLKGTLVERRTLAVLTVAFAAAALTAQAEYAERGGRLIVFNDFNALDANLNPKTGGVGGWKGAVRPSGRALRARKGVLPFVPL